MASTESGIRPLDSRDWEAFREIRLLALRAEPGVFTASYEESAAKPPEGWQAMLSGPGRRVFGLFEGGRLVGITGVITDQGDATGGTALLVMSFLLPEYRGRGLSRRFYEARLEWVRSCPGFTKVVVSHRASNEASRRANQRHGFRLTGREAKRWPDGIVEDEVFYELPLA